MKETKSVIKDPICGMTVNEATALQAERDGKTFYFCSDQCRQKFLPPPPVIRKRASLDPVVNKDAALNTGVISAQGSRIAALFIHRDIQTMNL